MKHVLTLMGTLLFDREDSGQALIGELSDDREMFVRSSPGTKPTNMKWPSP